MIKLTKSFFFLFRWKSIPTQLLPFINNNRILYSFWILHRRLTLNWDENELIQSNKFVSNNMNESFLFEGTITGRQKSLIQNKKKKRKLFVCNLCNAHSLYVKWYKMGRLNHENHCDFHVNSVNGDWISTSFYGHLNFSFKQTKKKKNTKNTLNFVTGFIMDL